MNLRALALALRTGSQVVAVFAIPLTTSAAYADPPFMATPFSAFSPTPNGWVYSAGTLKNDAVGSNKKRLIVPLYFESVSWMSSLYWRWEATLEAGGATKTSRISCTMYAVANQTPLNSSSTANFDGSSTSMSFAIDSTLGRAVYIDCWVPPGAWIGNVWWTYAPVKDP